MKRKKTLKESKQLMHHYALNVEGILEDMYLGTDWEGFEENLSCLAIAEEDSQKEGDNLIKFGADLSPLEYQLNSLLARN
jgi:hypothetical protein